MRVTETPGCSEVACHLASFQGKLLHLQCADQHNPALVLPGKYTLVRGEICIYLVAALIVYKQSCLYFILLFRRE